LAAGFFSGLLGLGGGFILIPGMTGLLGRQIRTAFGTSLVALAVYAIPGSIIHYYLGHINPKIMILLIIGVIPGAYLGGRAAILIKESVLRFLFGLFLIVVALYFGFFEARIVF
ncbi:MAG: sulfite exporter TauE/SafE family protein, partial [Chloroflexi bacterium]|nr:sulfite exporter TauE/SafE family protein [Chloroflexota bacterium]